MRRPETSEYAEFYAGYVARVPETDIISVLDAQPGEIRELFAGVNEDRGQYSYAPGKWTVKQLLGHLNDGERIFGYRAFRISHGDATPLPGFEQDIYVTNGKADLCSIANLIEEFELLRRVNMLVFDRLRDDEWSRIGTASDATVSVRALGFVMAGHVRHHTSILQERYLS